MLKLAPADVIPRHPSLHNSQTPLGVAEAKAVAPALSPEEWRPFKLVHKEALTHGANPTVLFRFALPDAGQEVGLPVASCLLTRAPIGSEKPDGSRAWVIRWVGGDEWMGDVEGKPRGRQTGDGGVGEWVISCTCTPPGSVSPLVSSPPPRCAGHTHQSATPMRKGTLTLPSRWGWQPGSC